MVRQSLVGEGLLIVKTSQTHSVEPPGRVISPMQRPLSDNTQDSLETDIHACGMYRSCNSSKRAAVDPRLRPCNRWDR